MLVFAGLSAILFPWCCLPRDAFLEVLWLAVAGVGVWLEGYLTLSLIPPPDSVANAVPFRDMP